MKAILRQERTDFGKKIRSSYERKEIALKRMDMKEYKPRTDGISNTLTGGNERQYANRDCRYLKLKIIAIWKKQRK